MEIIYEVENAGEIIYEVGNLGRRLWANCLYLSLPTPSPESSLCHLLNLTKGRVQKGFFCHFIKDKNGSKFSQIEAVRLGEG